MDAAASLGHGPMREALIEIARQESNERWMDPGIGVEAVHGPEPVAMANRAGRRGTGDSPARPTASRQAFQRRCTARRSSPARSSSSLRAADAARAFAGTSVRNRDNAAGFFQDPRRARGPSRRECRAARPPARDRGGSRRQPHRSRRVAPSCSIEQRLHVPGENAARRQLVAIARLGQERFAPQAFGGVLDRLFERQVLEGVQRVVVDEDADGPLRRQQLRQAR